MGNLLMCLIGLHRWRWFSLYDPDIRYGSVHMSQCLYCSTIRGGWRGQSSKEANPHG